MSVWAQVTCNVDMRMLTYKTPSEVFATLTNEFSGQHSRQPQYAVLAGAKALQCDKNNLRTTSKHGTGLIVS